MEKGVHWPSEISSDWREQHNVEVFAIRDFGSRSKNMAGPDSDIDAMVLFDQPAMASKTLNTGEDAYIDTIDPSGEVYGVDVHGWNLQKFGSLLADSNPQAMEFLNSPLHYFHKYPSDTYEELLEDLRLYANRNFNPIRLYMHYRNQAKSNYTKYILRKLQHEDDTRYRIHREDYNEGHVCYNMDEIEGSPDPSEDQPYYIHEDNPEFTRLTTDRTVRRNLKVIRGALYARHIRRTKSFPEMDFRSFLEHSVSAEIQQRVEDFLLMKEEGNGDMEAGNPFSDIVEYEITHEPDHDDLNRRGIEKERVNEFIRTIDQKLWD